MNHNETIRYLKVENFCVPTFSALPSQRERSLTISEKRKRQISRAIRRKRWPLQQEIDVRYSIDVRSIFSSKRFADISNRVSSTHGELVPRCVRYIQREQARLNTERVRGTVATISWKAGTMVAAVPPTVKLSSTSIITTIERAFLPLF